MISTSISSQYSLFCKHKQNAMYCCTSNKLHGHRISDNSGSASACNDVNRIEIIYKLTQSTRSMVRRLVDH